MVKEIQPQELKKKMHDKDILVVDIRDPITVAHGSIPGSRNIDVYTDIYAGDLEGIKKKLSVLPKDKTIVTICNSGRTSLYATQILENMGYKSASLAGGMDAWN